METEFERIERENLWLTLFNEIREESAKHKHTCKDGKKSENRSLNRYRDVIPYDHSRVRLKRLPNDYVNASLVSVENADRAYILTQGPLPATVSHFWLMIWEQGTNAILMLNRLMEKGAIKCHQYWPNGLHADDIDLLEFNDVQLSVQYKNEFNYSHYIVRQFLLTDLQSGEIREIKHYNYTSWPDFGLPESPSSFLELLNAVRASGSLDDVNKPPVIHCSAGIGRSGTFCLVDTCLVLLEKYPQQELSIKELLLHMRKYRTGLIQTPDQLRFSYMVVNEGAKKLRSSSSPPPPTKNSSAVETTFINEKSDKMKINNDVHYENNVNGNEHNQKLPLSLPKQRKTGNSVTSSTSSSSSTASNSFTNDERNKSAMISKEEEEEKEDKEEEDDDDEKAINSNNNKQKEGKIILLNNNFSTGTELRKRLRDERNKKTMENIKRIKEKQKEMEERSQLRNVLFKYAKFSLGVVFVVGTGFLLYHNLSSSPPPLPEVNVS